MPIQPTYPGVYIQEVSSGVRTITGVSTSIAAFFGRTEKGPINKAVRCLSYSDFLRNFGGPHPLSDLGASVNQFFGNGGTDCYVVRLAKNAGPSSVTLRNVADNENVLTAIAKAPGTWGQGVKLVVDYNTTNPEDSFNLTVIHEADGAVVKTEVFNNISMNPQSSRFAPTFVTQSSKLIDLDLHADMGDPTLPGSFINNPANTPRGFSQSRRVFVGANAQGLRDAIRAAIIPLVDITIPANRQSMFVLNLDGKKDIPVDLGGINIPATPNTANLTNPIKNRIDAAIAPVLAGVTVTVSIDTFATPAPNPNGGVLRISADHNDGPNVTIRSASSNDFAAPMMFGIDNGGIEVARFSNMRPVPNGAFFSGGNLNDLTAGANGLNAFTGILQDAMTAIAFNAALVPAPTPTPVNLVTTLPSPPVSPNFVDASGGNTGLIEKLRTIQQAVNDDVNSPCKAELWGYRLVFKKKSGTINDTTTVATTGAAAFGNGFTLNSQRYSLGNLSTSPFELLPWPALSSGSDGTVPGQTEYVGSPITHTGFYALDTVDLFNLMILPADREFDVVNIKGAASTYCLNHRAFLLLDAPANWTDVDHPVADATTVNTFRIGVSKQHSAIFYPRVQYSDAGIKKYIGPSGMIAGLMARTDAQRGVWKAPAGIEADLRGLVDLEIDLTDNENGVLNKLGVNCIRKFPNGIVSWGARTLDGSDDFGSEWKYIPIRRLALFLEESLFRGTKWVVFEPNDEPLWAKIRMNINAFMMGLFRQGAFQGSTPDKAFFVKCDGETTTANDRNLGIVNIQVGFAPLKPAEFVIISIQQIPDV
ncbi:MAG: phage tail sheath subtilisin-like domain-containing protein [Planctomycetota bacterium]